MAETTTKKHPIRTALYGFVSRLGVAILLTLVYPVIALESLSQVITKWVVVVVIVMIISALWRTFGPAKAPEGPMPVSAMAPPTECSTVRLAVLPRAAAKLPGPAETPAGRTSLVGMT